MTLLSIREQEAVQAARETLFSYLTQDYCGRGCDEVMLQKRVDESLAILLDKVILATRDAIARQVREEAVRRDHEGTISDRADKKVWFRVATFIEGLE